MAIPLPTDVAPALSAPERQAALRRTGLLDRPAEPALERLTLLATKTLAAPMALVSLVDADRQFFASSRGLPEPWQSRRQSPLSHSFCQYAVASAAPLVVRDAREHPELRDNAAIADFGAVAYAGVPLVTATGQVLGAFAVLDTRPREWTGHELDLLGDLAAVARAQIERGIELAERQETEERFRGLAEQSLVGIYMIRDGRFVYANPRLAEIFGRTVDELLALPSFLDAIHPDDRAVLGDRMRRRLAGEVLDGPSFFRGLRPDGGIIDIEAHGTVARHEGSESAVGAALDVTERRRSEAALRASEAELRAVLDAMSEVILVIDDEGRYLKVAPGAHHRVVLPPERLLGHTFHELFEPEVADRFLAYTRRALAENRPVNVEYPLPIDGEAAWFAAALTRLDDHRVLWVARDITERKHAEEQLRRSEARLRALVAATAQIVWTVDSLGQAHEDSPTWRAFTGQSVEEAFGHGWFDVVHPDDRARVDAEWQAATRELRIFATEYRVRHRSGEYRPMAIRAVPVRDETTGEVREWIGTATDVGEQRAAEEALLHSEAQLRQAQKMEAVGQLAGGVAHDFNNLLAAIAVNCALLESTIEGGPGSEEVEEIHRATERASLLTRQLLTFSRKQVVQPQVLDLNRVVADSLLLIERLPGEGISVELELGSGAGPVRADPGQVTQVLMNLAVNARDAMPIGGTLSIRTENRRAADGGEWVTLAVRDTGVGMDAETQARIFEPFFTTKAPGKGTGLGLSTVYGIVQQSGGHILLDSAPGAGTTVTVYLPRVEDGALPAPATAPERRLPRGSETVLLVEDESTVRSSVRRLLGHHGYTVLEARHGADALRLFDAADAPRIDLVLTDIVMPEMNGRQFVEQLRARGGTMPVLFMSGYDQEALSGHGAQPAGTAFLPKPFTVEALLQAVRDALDGRTTSR